MSLGMLLAGCASYTPKPLAGGVIEGELSPPDQPAIRALVSQLPDPALSSITIDLSDGVSPDEAAVITLVLNPALRAQRAQRGIANAETFNAGLLPDPSLSLGIDVPAGGVTTDTVTGYALGIDWAASDLIERPARKASARRNAESVDLRLLWDESIEATNARSLVYQVAGWENALSLLDQQVALLEDQADRMGRALKEGQVTAIEASATRTTLDSFKAQRADANQQLRDARIDLLTEMGFPPDATLDVRVDFDDGLDATPPDLAGLLDHIETNRYDLLALRLGYASQEEQVRLSVLRQFPRLSIGPNIARDTGDLTTIGLGIGLELPIFNANRGEIAIARAQREQLAREYTARVHDARSEIARQLNTLRSAREKYEALQASAARREQLIETYQSALAQGQIDILSYEQAREELVSLKLDALQAAARIHAARLMIETLSGTRPVPGGSNGAQAQGEAP